MNESLKVQPRHLERGAYLYIRQSSMRQVIENVESTKRQYALRGRAVALGWREDQIIVIDAESTCWEDRPPENDASEIIEVGICVVNVHTWERIAQESLLVQPTYSSLS